MDLEKSKEVAHREDAKQARCGTGYLPDWIDPGDDLFVRGESWRLLYGLGCDPGWPESWQRGLLAILRDEPVAGGSYATAEADCLACITYLRWTGLRLNGTPRQGRSVELTRSMRTQLVEWLDDYPETEYPSPYSLRQWKKVVRGRYNGYGALKERARRIVAQLDVDTESGADMWPAEVTGLVPAMEQGKVTYKPRKAKRKAKPETKPETPQIEAAPGCAPLGLRPMGKDPEAAEAVREWEEKQNQGQESQESAVTCTAQVCFEYC